MILIQSDSDRKLPHHFDAACALYGVMDTAEDYRLTSFEEIESGKLDIMLRINASCVVGSTEFMQEVFKRLGKENVGLPRNSNRNSEVITLGEAHQRVAAGKKLFVKPIKNKLFTGLVLDGAKYSCLNGLPDDTKVFAYEPFPQKLISEWRIYVHRHKMIDARNYSGDYCKIFNPTYVNHVINENKVDFPVAYTLDVGIFEEYTGDYILRDSWELQNVVVEFNDMWAIGNYGIPNDLYLQLLKDRYNQIKNGY